MQTVIKKILSDRKRFLSLLLLADEQETMIDKYIGRGDMFVMYTQDGVAICSAIVTDEGNGICEIKSLAVAPEFQRKGYGKEMTDFLSQFVDVLAAYPHQTCCLRKGEVFLLFQRRAQFLHLLHMAQLHLPFHHAVFVTSFRALRAAITGCCFLCDERFSAPLTNSFYFHIFVLFSAILHEF